MQLTEDTFNCSTELDDAHETLLHQLVHGRVLRSFQLGLTSELVVVRNWGAVLEQQQRPMIDRTHF